MTAKKSVRFTSVSVTLAYLLFIISYLSHHRLVCSSMSPRSDSTAEGVLDVKDPVKDQPSECLKECESGDSFMPNPEGMSPKAKVQLRPVGHPSPVTLLFEYTVKAWNNQKGDHCTYRYIPSREPTSHMEMIATVLVRLPKKQPLYVKDTKPRASRVIAQNSVAQLALEKLAVDDAELAEKLETIKKEHESSGSQGYPQRFNGSPYRSHRPYRSHMPHYYPQYPQYFMPSEGMVVPPEGEFLPPPPPPMFYPMVSYESEDGQQAPEQLMTPTFGAPYGYGFPPMPHFMPPPPEMMYYPQHMMPVMMQSPEVPRQDEGAPTEPTVY
jgi:hypothetical protein